MLFGTIHTTHSYLTKVSVSVIDMTLLKFYMLWLCLHFTCMFVCVYEDIKVSKMLVNIRVYIIESLILELNFLFFQFNTHIFSKMFTVFCFFVFLVFRVKNNCLLRQVYWTCFKIVIFLSSLEKRKYFHACLTLCSKHYCTHTDFKTWFFSFRRKF